MKMTKIESARIIKKGINNIPACRGVKCNDCFNSYLNNNYNGCSDDGETKVKKAEAYIKRHESKTKKPSVKTDVRDMANVVKDVTVKESLKVDPTPLEIAKMIRDNEYGCHKIVLCDKCPIEKIPCGNSATTKEHFDIRKKAIDTYISEHEKVEPIGNTEKLKSVILKKVVCIDNNLCDIMLTVGKEYVVLGEHNGFFYIKENDCNNGDILHKSRFITTEEYAKRVNIQDVEPVMPEPISIEELRKMICFKDEYIYYFNRDEKIGRVNTKHIYEMRITGKHIVMLCGTIVEAENYYKTLADAVRVAEEKWSKK
jgi:hypothetical protein